VATNITTKDEIPPSESSLTGSQTLSQAFKCVLQSVSKGEQGVFHVKKTRATGATQLLRTSFASIICCRVNVQRPSTKDAKEIEGRSFAVHLRDDSPQLGCLRGRQLINFVSQALLAECSYLIDGYLSNNGIGY
jgi:hypothetical protein